jgi:hypothetical protein
MKSGSNQSNQRTVCSMCGAMVGDFWQTRPTRPVVLRLHPRPGDLGQVWILCDECHEGLRGLHRQPQRQSQDLDTHVVERNGYTCQMCGAAAGDPDPLGGTRTVRLTMGHIIDKSKGGDDSPQNLRAVCTDCNEGLQNTSLPKPNRIHLLAQVRRATIQDQRALLDWMLRKFNLQTVEKQTKKPKKG